MSSASPAAEGGVGRAVSAAGTLIARLPGGRARAGAGVLLALGLIALLAPAVSPHDPNAIDASRVLGGPDGSHLLGSDDLGRDVLSRLLEAYRVSLAVSLGSVILAFVAGSTLGAVAGFFGGWPDALLMRPVDMLLALPALLLALSIIAVTGPGAGAALLAIAVIYTPVFARVVRSSALVVRGQPFVDASRARAAPVLSIVAGHVLPNALGPALVQAAVLAGIALQIEAALAYLGLGARPPTPSLGNMLSEGRDFLARAPWLEVYPGLAIAITVAAFSAVGEGLRRSLDPRAVTR